MPDDPRRLHRRLCPAGRSSTDAGRGRQSTRRRRWRSPIVLPGVGRGVARRPADASTSRRSSSSCAARFAVEQSRLQRAPTALPRSPTSASSRRGPPAEPPDCLGRPRRLYGGHVNAASSSAPRPSLLVLSGRLGAGVRRAARRAPLRPRAAGAGGRRRPGHRGRGRTGPAPGPADVERWRLPVTVLVHDELVGHGAQTRRRAACWRTTCSARWSRRTSSPRSPRRADERPAVGVRRRAPGHRHPQDRGRRPDPGHDRPRGTRGRGLAAGRAGARCWPRRRRTSRRPCTTSPRWSPGCGPAVTWSWCRRPSLGRRVEHHRAVHLLECVDEVGRRVRTEAGHPAASVRGRSTVAPRGTSPAAGRSPAAAAAAIADRVPGDAPHHPRAAC